MYGKMKQSKEYHTLWIVCKLCVVELIAIINSNISLNGRKFIAILLVK